MLEYLKIDDNTKAIIIQLKERVTLTQLQKMSDDIKAQVPDIPFLIITINSDILVVQKTDNGGGV